MARFLVAHVFCGAAQSTFVKLRADICSLFELDGDPRTRPCLPVLGPLHVTDSGIGLALTLDQFAKTRRPFGVRFAGFVGHARKTWLVTLEPSADLLQLRGAVADAAFRRCDVFIGPHGCPDLAAEAGGIAIAHGIDAGSTYWRVGSYLRQQPLPVRSLTCDSLSLLREEPWSAGWVEMHRYRFGGGSS